MRAPRWKLRRGISSLLLVALLALAGAGCGGGDSSASSQDTGPSIPDTQVTQPPATTKTQTQTQPGGAATVPNESGGENGQAPDTTSSNGGTPSYNPSKPDSSKNDVPPAPNTPQSKFEQQCNAHPAACG